MFKQSLGLSQIVWKMDVSFGNSDVRGLCRTGALKTVFYLVGLQEIKWGRGDIDQRGTKHFHPWKKEWK
jgi:hypothetical protein